MYSTNSSTSGHDVAPRALDVELMTVEMENQRLEEEIFNLKLHRSRKKMDKGRRSKVTRGKPMRYSNKQILLGFGHFPHWVFEALQSQNTDQQQGILGVAIFACPTHCLFVESLMDDLNQQRPRDLFLFFNSFL